MNDVVVVPDRGEVLRNRGLRLRVHVLDVDPSVSSTHPKVTRRVVAGSDDGEYVYEYLWFKFTNAILAECEQEPPFGFGGLENLGEQMQAKMFTTLGTVFAMMDELYITRPDGLVIPDWKSGALRLIDGEMVGYVTALLAALQISQGARPEVVGEQLLEELRRRRTAIEEAAVKGFLPTQTAPGSDSPSNNGSPDGASSTETSTSSGD